MKAEDLIKEGKPQEAIDALMQAVRDDPSNSSYRVFLFQLMSVIGEYDRALKQLNVVGEMDDMSIPMVQSYREILQCEVLRQSVFAGEKQPMIFGKPEAWIASILEAIRLSAQGHHGQAQELRAKAYEEIPGTSGKIDGKPFEWIADADSRIGPFLEAIVNGKYYWIPFNRIKKIKFYEPVDLRDLVWLPAEFEWPNEGEAVGFIPARYPGSDASGDAQLQMARRTDWQDMGDNAYYGLGQRILSTDEEDYAMMDIREIEFDTVDDAPQEATTESE